MYEIGSTDVADVDEDICPRVYTFCSTHEHRLYRNPKAIVLNCCEGYL